VRVSYHNNSDNVVLGYEEDNRAFSLGGLGRMKSRAVIDYQANKYGVAQVKIQDRYTHGLLDLNKAHSQVKILSTDGRGFQ